MIPLLIKEIKELLSGWLAYTAILIFCFVSFMFLWIFPDSSYFSYGYASSQLFFEFAYYLLLFVVPAMSVGLFSPEFRNGTFEVLGALPLSWAEIIGAKFLSGLVAIALLLLVSLPTIYVIHDIALQPVQEGAQIIGSLIGLLLIGGCFLAISLAISTFFGNSSIAFLSSIIVGFLMYSGFGLISRMAHYSFDMQYFIQRFGLVYHADYLSRGVIPLSSIFYLLTIIGAFLSLAFWNLKSRNF